MFPGQQDARSVSRTVLEIPGRLASMLVTLVSLDVSFKKGHTY